MIKMTWKQELLTFRCILVWWAKYLPCKQQIPTHLISLLLIIIFYSSWKGSEGFESTRQICTVSTSEIKAGNEQFDHEVFYCILILQAKATYTFPACCRWGNRLWLLSTKPISTIALNQDNFSSRCFLSWWHDEDNFESFKSFMKGGTLLEENNLCVWRTEKKS